MHEIIPESNKTTGNIGVEYLIFKYRLNIYEEHFFPIKHNLLGVKGSKINEIKKDIIGEINIIIFINFIPAQTIIGKIVKRYTSAVPRSGCFKIKRAINRV